MAVTDGNSASWVGGRDNVGGVIGTPRVVFDNYAGPGNDCYVAPTRHVGTPYRFTARASSVVICVGATFTRVSRREVP